MANNNNQRTLDQILRAIEKIAAPIPAIPPIPPIPPIPAILPVVPSGDHELLQRLDVKVDALKEDIRLLTDGTGKKIDEHESRIKTVETAVTKVWAYGTAMIFVVGLLEFFLLKFLK